MGKESTAMKEIHEIRLRNYDITKNMSISEKIAYIKSKADMGKKGWRN